MTHRFTAVAGATALAALLGACASPTQPVATSYPSAPVYAPVATAPGTTQFPSASVNTGAVATAPAAVELGRVTDIQTVQMGATSATNPNVGRAIAGGIIGAVVGNVVGKNVNSGDNRTLGTVLGGAAGAAVGARTGENQASNTASSGGAAPAYRVTVQTDQGQWRTYEVGALGDLRVGDRVRVEGGVIYRS